MLSSNSTILPAISSLAVYHWTHTLNEYWGCVCVYTCRPGLLKEKWVSGPLEQEGQMVWGHLVIAGNWILILCKSKQSVLFIPEQSLQNSQAVLHGEEKAKDLCSRRLTLSKPFSLCQVRKHAVWRLLTFSQPNLFIDCLGIWHDAPWSHSLPVPLQYNFHTCAIPSPPKKNLKYTKSNLCSHILAGAWSNSQWSAP